ncbi:hypothetical protein DL771_012429 [Monosporascus sp. 5C6A]|nr:hypothetical protein DL771_012429 [Monosporascus sp. 5C6A]
MVADELGLMLGCQGLRAIRTPRLDQLAAQGTRSTNAFASTMHCSGSRFTIYMGLHAHQNVQYGLQQDDATSRRTRTSRRRRRFSHRSGTRPASSARCTSGPPRSTCPAVLQQGRGDVAVVLSDGRALGPHRDKTREGFGDDEGDVRDIGVPDYKAADVEIPPFISDVPGFRTELVEYYKSISRVELSVGLIPRGAGEARPGQEQPRDTRQRERLRVPQLRDHVIRRRRAATPPHAATRREIGRRETQHGFFHRHLADMHRVQAPPEHRLAARLPPPASDPYGRLSWEGIRNAAPTGQSDTPEVMLGRRRLQNYVYRGPEELFDLENDPRRWTTWRAKPEFEALRREVRAKLGDWQYETDDPGLFRDGVSAMTTHAAQKLGMRLPDRFDFDPK